MSQNYTVQSVDIAPANKNVAFCDFTTIEFSDKESIIEQFTEFQEDGVKIINFKKNSFDVCCFMFLLSYLPDPEQRLEGKLLQYILKSIHLAGVFFAQPIFVGCFLWLFS